MEHHAYTHWQSQTGTAGKRYDRTHTIAIPGKPDIVLTTANHLTGDPGKLNPEDLLVASVSSCHMLTYLYLCAANGISVTGYTDHAIGTLPEVNPERLGLSQVTLHPMVIVATADMIEKAILLHEEAHHNCIIANSVKFSITVNPVCKLQQDQ